MNIPPFSQSFFCSRREVDWMDGVDFQAFCVLVRWSGECHRDCRSPLFPLRALPLPFLHAIFKLLPQEVETGQGAGRGVPAFSLSSQNKPPPPDPHVFWKDWTRGLLTNMAQGHSSCRCKLPGACSTGKPASWLPTGSHQSTRQMAVFI